MNALGATILITAVLSILMLPRRLALLAIVGGIIYLPQSQGLDFGGFNLFAARLVVLAGFLRVLLRKDLFALRLNKIDRTLLFFHLFTVTVFMLRSDESKTYEVGIAVDALLTYLTFRALIDGHETYRWVLRWLPVLLGPFAVLVCYETINFNNLFGPLGAVTLSDERWVRGDRLRALGSFGHPSLMGTLGGAFAPLYVGLWLEGRARIAATVGLFCCLAIVWASNSGGPAICVMFTIIGWMFWPVRTQMQWVRRGLVAALAVIAMLMKAPIWYLIGRLGSITGGDGWHRAELLDVAFRNIDLWWLAGMPLDQTASWLPYTNTMTGVVDMTNHFLLFGVMAGMGAMLLLIGVVTQGYKGVGRALAAIRQGVATPGHEHDYWALGVMLTVHVANWFSITYWDQVNLIWFLHLAALSSLTALALEPAVSRAVQPSIETSRVRPFTPPALQGVQWAGPQVRPKPRTGPVRTVRRGGH